MEADGDIFQRQADASTHTLAKSLDTACQEPYENIVSARELLSATVLSMGMTAQSIGE